MAKTARQGPTRSRTVKRINGKRAMWQEARPLSAAHQRSKRRRQEQCQWQQRSTTGAESRRRTRSSSPTRTEAVWRRQQLMQRQREMRQRLESGSVSADRRERSTARELPFLSRAGIGRATVHQLLQHCAMPPVSGVWWHSPRAAPAIASQWSTMVVAAAAGSRR